MALRLVEIDRTVFKQDTIGGPMFPGSGGSVYVYLRGTTTQVTVYGEELGLTPLTQPLATDADGQINGWVNVGSYDLAVTIGGISRTQAYEACAPSQSVTAKTTNYTLALADVQVVTEVNSSGAVSLTVPPESSVPFAVGATLEVVRYGLGAVSIIRGNGVALRTRETTLGLPMYGILPGGRIRLYKRGSDDWVLSGDLTAAPSVMYRDERFELALPAAATGQTGYSSITEVGGGDVSVVTSVAAGVTAVEGDYVAKHLIPAGATARTARGTSVMPALIQGSELWIERRIYIPAGFVTGVGGNINLLRLASGTDAGEIDLLLAHTQDRLQLTMWDGSANTYYHQADVAGNAFFDIGIEEGRWHKFGIHLILHATAGKALTELWLNGVRKFRDVYRKNMVTSATSYTNLHTIDAFASTSPGAFTLYVDDGSVTSQGRISRVSEPYAKSTTRLQNFDNHSAGGPSAAVSLDATKVYPPPGTPGGSIKCHMGATTTGPNGNFARVTESVHWFEGMTVSYGCGAFIATSVRTALGNEEVGFMRWKNYAEFGGSGFWDICPLKLTTTGQLEVGFEVTPNRGIDYTALISNVDAIYDAWVWYEIRQKLSASDGEALTELYINGTLAGRSYLANYSRIITDVDFGIAYMSTNNNSTTAFDIWVDRSWISPTGVLLGP